MKDKCLIIVKVAGITLEVIIYLIVNVEIAITLTQKCALSVGIMM